MNQLTNEDYMELREKGFSDGEINNALKEIEHETLSGSYNQVQARRDNDPRQNSQISSFQTKNEDNLAKWQLELNDILERAEHILRGDTPKYEQGNVIWIPNKHPEDNPLNEKGINEIIKRLVMYINRNTILSDYSNDEINIKMYDFGREINNLIFMRSEDFGMITDDKKKSYPMIVREIIDMVHSSYKRALDGAEKRSMREYISITQTNQIPTQQNQLQGGVPSQERGLLNPMRYVKGRYV